MPQNSIVYLFCSFLLYKQFIHKIFLLRLIFRNIFIYVLNIHNGDFFLSIRNLLLQKEKYSAKSQSCMLCCKVIYCFLLYYTHIYIIYFFYKK